VAILHSYEVRPLGKSVTSSWHFSEQDTAQGKLLISARRWSMASKPPGAWRCNLSAWPPVELEVISEVA
jgi:hypothetical protein